MNHVNKERIKSIILIVLFVISLIQVGILWTNQSHRLPFSFLGAIFGSRQLQVSDEMTREELFIPYRLVISNGDSAHWIPDRKSQIYKPLWDEVKTYLADVVNGNISPSADSQETWGETTSKRGFTFEFKMGIRPDLLKWFLGNSSSTVDIPTVYKIMVIPENNNDSQNTLYIYDANNRVYKYLTKGFVREKSFADILSVFENDNKGTYREFITMHDSNLESKLNIGPDVLYVNTHPVFWPYGIISCSIPGNVSNMNELAETILGNEKERYSPSKYNDGTIHFSNRENLYKIYPEGILEYKYLSSTDTSGREGIGPALLNAYGLIKKVVSLTNTKADIYLAGIEPLESGNYRFDFDYMINGQPVHIDLTSVSSEGTAVQNAIIIEANSEKVISSRIIIRDFAVSGEKNYNDRFFDIKFDSTFKKDQLKLRDIGVGYVIDTVDEKLLEPYMVLENKGTPKLIIEKMPEQ